MSLEVALVEVGKGRKRQRSGATASITVEDEEQDLASVLSAQQQQQEEGMTAEEVHLLFQIFDEIIPQTGIYQVRSLRGGGGRARLERIVRSNR